MPDSGVLISWLIVARNSRCSSLGELELGDVAERPEAAGGAVLAERDVVEADAAAVGALEVDEADGLADLRRPRAAARSRASGVGEQALAWLAKITFGVLADQLVGALAELQQRAGVLVDDGDPARAGRPSGSP